MIPDKAAAETRRNSNCLDNPMFYRYNVPMPPAANAAGQSTRALLGCAGVSPAPTPEPRGSPQIPAMPAPPRLPARQRGLGARASRPHVGAHRGVGRESGRNPPPRPSPAEPRKFPHRPPPRLPACQRELLGCAGVSPARSRPPHRWQGVGTQPATAPEPRRSPQCPPPSPPRAPARPGCAGILPARRRAPRRWHGVVGGRDARAGTPAIPGNPRPSPAEPRKFPQRPPPARQRGPGPRPSRPHVSVAATPAQALALSAPGAIL